MAIDWDGLVLQPVMGVFGEELIYTPRGGSPVTIPDAVVDDEATEMQLDGDGQTTIQKRPIIGIRASALPADARQNDTVKVTKTGKVYVVREAIPDGHGHIVLKVMVTA